MYTGGLSARLVGLGSGSDGLAVATAGFVWAWVRGAGLSRVPPPLQCQFGAGGFKVPVAVCADGPLLTAGGFY